MRTLIILTFLTLFETALSWTWPTHVVIYMIARNIIVPYKYMMQWEGCQERGERCEELKRKLRKPKLKVVRKGMKVLKYVDSLMDVDKLMDEVEEARRNVTRYRNGKPNKYAIAGWADGVKRTLGGTFSNRAHYYAQIYKDGIKDISGVLNKEKNAIKALKNAYKELTSRSGRISAGRKSRMMAFLIHLVGDVHQPLHMASRVSRKYPKGDKGADTIKISVKGVKNAKTLHALWNVAMGYAHVLCVDTVSYTHLTLPTICSV
eukprot:TRINITY_DN11856_c0_g1_i2.p1 TRINITY_DN11856_c0_g1~~TRINITY_DN11856_c0_g1_i2.p1  ORF type:complete len:262 (-),score=32.46 TRINITY_DN11856_c0_g1_i2:40-825(-)